MKTTIPIASWRRGVLGVIATLAIFGTASAADAAEHEDQIQKRFIRQSLQEFVKDQNKLDSLIRGVQVMKSRNNAPKNSVEYRTSWEYWAAIHGYAGKSSPNGTVEEIQEAFRQAFPDDAPLFAGFWAGLQNLTPPAHPRGMAKKTWATCEHFDPVVRTRHFLSWHRIALYFFERVLREASGDPNFALPYWDYTNDAIDPVDPVTSPGRMPVDFILPTLDTPSGTIEHPLFERRRTRGLGFLVQLDLSGTNADSVLKLSNFTEFQETLDQGVHGFIHCAVGNRCLAPHMGVIAFSANDPIFWVHHANIDRLWECWTTRNGRDANPTSDRNWMKKKFSFVNEKGRLVTMKVSELFDPEGRIDYEYDNVSQCFRTEPSSERTVALQEPGKESISAKISKTPIATRSEVEIDQIDQEVPLAQSTEKGVREARLSAVQPSAVSPSKAVLKLKGVRAEKPPGASVSVFLTDHQGKNREFVGVLGFFGQFDHSHKAHARDADKGSDFTFDVSAQLHTLLAENPTGGDIRVALVASSGLAEEAAAVNQERYQEAGLRIREILLEVESGGSTPVNPGE